MKLYRPSNGTEGDIFMEEFCFHCVYYQEENGCPIQAQTMSFGIEDAEYPNQWRYDKDDKPICNCFWKKK